MGIWLEAGRCSLPPIQQALYYTVLYSVVQAVAGGYFFFNFQRAMDKSVILTANCSVVELENHQVLSGTCQDVTVWPGFVRRGSRRHARAPSLGIRRAGCGFNILISLRPAFGSITQQAPSILCTRAFVDGLVECPQLPLSILTKSTRHR